MYQGNTLMILSDNQEQPHQLPIHALLATGAMHHHLTHSGQRCDANIIVATGTARDAHQIAALIGYGATAVYPFLSYLDRKSTRLNSSHVAISYAVFCLKKKTNGVTRAYSN